MISTHLLAIYNTWNNQNPMSPGRFPGQQDMNNQNPMSPGRFPGQTPGLNPGLNQGRFPGQGNVPGLNNGIPNDNQAFSPQRGQYGGPGQAPFNPQGQN